MTNTCNWKRERRFRQSSGQGNANSDASSDHQPADKDPLAGEFGPNEIRTSSRAHSGTTGLDTRPVLGRIMISYRALQWCFHHGGPGDGLCKVEQLKEKDPAVLKTFYYVPRDNTSQH